MYFCTYRMFTVTDFEKFDMRILREIMTPGEIPLIDDAESSALTIRGNFTNLLR